MVKHPHIRLRFLANLFLLFVAVGCSETEIVPDAQMTITSESESARKSKPMLSAFTYNERTYQFSYNPDGTVSTIIAIQGGTEIYRYVASYGDGRLLSADLVENGAVMSSNTNFEYDKKGRIVAYEYVSYFFPEYPDGLAQPITLSYDKKGNLIQYGQSEELQYDNRRNLVQWGSMRFTYDKTKNPLASIPYLWILFVEEPFLIEYILSPNNSTTKIFSNGNKELFVNEFNDRGVLISKTGTINDSLVERFDFVY